MAAHIQILGLGLVARQKTMNKLIYIGVLGGDNGAKNKKKIAFKRM